jgi:FAD/FMN-containing dehydrogenase
MADTLAMPTPAQVEGFRSRFQGEVITPADAGFDDGRRVWNALYDLRPAILVRPTSTAEVAAAIRFGRDAGVPIQVRGGGHGVWAPGMAQGGLHIDLGRLNAVTVDPEARTARVGGGALLSALDQAAQAHGLVCPVGVIGHTGVGGLTLGGGIGRLMRRFGLTIDNLRRVELATATGDVVEASADEHPDLFWGIRGAGANFGAVTEFVFDLQPYDGRLTRGIRMYDGRQIRDVWEVFQRFAATATDSLGMTFGAGRAVPEADYPEAIAGKPMAFVAFSHSGDPATVEDDLAALAAGPKPAFEALTPTTYLEIQAVNDEAMRWGLRTWTDSRFSNGFGAGTLEAVIEHIANAPGDAGIGVGTFGGAVGRIADDATSFPSRAAFDMSADAGAWDDPADDERHIAWARQAMAIMERDAVTGRYVNETCETGEAVVRSTYGAERYDRLVALKRAWDPDNVFRANQNVAP